jgi:hypothetical protein
VLSAVMEYRVWSILDGEDTSAQKKGGHFYGICIFAPSQNTGVPYLEKRFLTG